MSSRSIAGSNNANQVRSTYSYFDNDDVLDLISRADIEADLEEAEAEAQRDDAAIETAANDFMNKFYQLFAMKDFEAISQLAINKRPLLLDRVDFTEILVHELKRCKYPADFTNVRRIAATATYMNPLKPFEKLVEALCYLKGGNQVSTLAILSAMDEGDKKIRQQMEIYQDHPLLFSFFTDLLHFSNKHFSTQRDPFALIHRV